MKIICVLVLFLTANLSYAGAGQDTIDYLETPVAVEVVNTPIIRLEAINPSDLVAEEFKISTIDGVPSMKISFEHDLVILHDISYTPIPPINRRISGVCRIKVLVNEVPLALGGWSLAGSSLNEPNNEGGGKSRPCGAFAEIEPGVCAPVTTLVVDVNQINKLPAIALTPDDVITVEVTPIPAQDDTDTDCEADFVVLAITTHSP